MANVGCTCALPLLCGILLVRFTLISKSTCTREISLRAGLDLREQGFGAGLSETELDDLLFSVALNRSSCEHILTTLFPTTFERAESTHKGVN